MCRGITMLGGGMVVSINVAQHVRGDHTEMRRWHRFLWCHGDGSGAAFVIVAGRSLHALDEFVDAVIAGPI